VVFTSNALPPLPQLPPLPAADTGNFSDENHYPCTHYELDPADYRCLGNRGRHLVYHLMQNRLWGYERLPIDGMKSVVFHGNSPTLCIGSGNVWIDHINISKQMCMTPKDILRYIDNPSLLKYYEFGHFFNQGTIIGTCLRNHYVRNSIYIFVTTPRLGVNF
jgi:hypothetical protein